MSTVSMTGDELLRVLGTLANPHRLRVVAALAQERNYVSQLARELGISRALLQVHLRKLEAAGLVSADIEVSADGKAMKFYEVTPFTVLLTPEVVEALLRAALPTTRTIQRPGQTRVGNHITRAVCRGSHDAKVKSPGPDAFRRARAAAVAASVL